MSELATPAMRWAQASVSVWLVAFLGLLLDAFMSRGYAPSQAVFGSVYAIVLIGLWRGVRWGFHLSIWLAWFATLMLWMTLIPMPDDRPSAMRGFKKILYGMDTDIWRGIMIGLVVAALVSTILLIRQKARFRPAWW